MIEFTAEVDIRPEFDVPDFAGLEATVDAKRDVTEEVAERIQLLRTRFATTAEVDRARRRG